MAFSFIYKRLFEVQLLHGRYLDKSEQEPFWNLTEKQQEEALRLYDIFEEVDIVPDAPTAELMRKHRMIFKKLKTGFVVGVEVKEDTFNGQPVVKPFIAIGEEFRLRFRLKLRNYWLWNLTQTRLRPNMPAKYYFTNQEEGDERIYPGLAQRTPLYVAGKWYEMGERVRFGVNDDIMEARQRTNLAPDAINAPWELVPLNHYYLTDEDRNLLPALMHYSFPPEAGVTQADVRLQQNGSDAVPPLSFSSSQPLQRIALDFQTVAAGFYDLEVTGDNNYLDQRRIYINNELYLGEIDQLHTPVSALPGQDPDARQVDPVSRVERQRLSREAKETEGFIEIVHQPGLGNYRLLEDEGHLRQEVVQGVEVTKPPVFELSLRARTTYWHYISMVGYDTMDNISGDVSLINVDGQPRLVSNQPWPLLLARSPLRLRYDVVNSNPVVSVERKLPNPEAFSLKEVEQKRKIGSEVFLSSI